MVCAEELDDARRDGRIYLRSRTGFLENFGLAYEAHPFSV